MKTLRIDATPKDLIDKIKILAKDNEQTVSEFLRPTIKAIADGCKPTMYSDVHSELSITGVSRVSTAKIELKAKKIGITVNQLLRLELYNFIENQSDFNKSLFL